MFNLLGLWRLWLGGGLGKSAIAAEYGMVLVLAALQWGTSHMSWQLCAVDAVGILFLARSLGHGPMLTLPITQRTDGAPDPLYELVAWIKNDELRWWAYSLLRYPAIAAPWGIARSLVGGAEWAPIIGALFIVILYRCLWPLRNALPQFDRPGDQVENWTELVGWTFLGALLIYA